MSEERTENLPDGRSFEERVFARFDAIDRRLDSVDARLASMDARLRDLDARVQVLESRAYDTKPIWERALAEILEVKRHVETIERKLDVLGKDVITVRADQLRLEDRIEKLESKPS